MSDADAVLDLAVRLARAAGRLQRERYETRFEVRVKGTPLDRLLVETDAPLLAPEGLRGRRNEPVHVASVGAVLAELHGLAPEEVARATTRNARRLFRLPEGA